MLKKVLAVSLLILTASPFTAPFSTCDASILFGSANQSAPSHAPVSPDTSTALVAIGSFSLLLHKASAAVNLQTGSGLHVSSSPLLSAARGVSPGAWPPTIARHLLSSA